MTRKPDPRPHRCLRAARSRTITVAGLLILLCGCDASQTTRQDGAEDAVPIVGHRVVFRTDETRIDAVGTARARKHAVIYADTGGEVTAVNFRAGERVTEGDVLLRLDDREQRLAVRQAEVAVREAEQLLTRYRRIDVPGAVSASQIDVAETALEAARLELELAAVALEDRTVRAPFSGFVGLTDVDAGARISTETVITQLDDRAELFVDFDLPEQVFGRIVAGDTLAMTPFSDPAQTREAEVVVVDSRIDTDNRNVVVRAAIDNGDDRLRPGMSFRINLTLPGQRFAAVPEAAIVWGGDGAYLWAVKDGAATRVAVTIVARDDGEVLVRAPLEEGDLVVAEGVQKVREGVAVEEREAATNSAPAAAIRAESQTP